MVLRRCAWLRFRSCGINTKMEVLHPIAKEACHEAQQFRLVILLFTPFHVVASTLQRHHIDDRSHDKEVLHILMIRTASPLIEVTVASLEQLGPIIQVRTVWRPLISNH